VTTARPVLALTGARLLTPDPSPDTAIMISSDGTIGALARSAGDWSESLPAADLGGALVTPAFVDAHVHTVQTGQLITGVDLAGSTSAAQVLDRVARWAAAHPGEPVLGHGWDDTGWTTGPPTPAEVDRVTGGAVAYLARVDVHSAVASTALLDRADRTARQTGAPLADRSGWTGIGRVSQDAHHLVRRAMDACFTDDQRRGFAHTALQSAAAAGIGTVHEMGGPHLGPVQDLDRVRDAGAALGVDVVGYWGDLYSTATKTLARRHGVRGLAGDLCADGAIGSRTASLTRPYADHPSSGVAYLDRHQVAAHVVGCTRSGLQAGFHCIGDQAVAEVVAGLRLAAESVGADAIRERRHRLEHVEMISDADVDTLAELAVVASMQPVFDAWWGGPDGLYRTRLGERAMIMNQLGTLTRRGVRVALGSDAPVTPLGGWGAVRAARWHHRCEERLNVGAALAAHTVGGHHAARAEHDGRLTVGAPATLAIWRLDPDQLPADGVPRLEPGDPDPQCLATVVRGRLVHAIDELNLDPLRGGPA